MKTQTRVRRKSDGRLGVVVNDNFDCCLITEVPVVYDGSTSFLGTDHTDLEDLGPENAIADLLRCGAGKGTECCIFLTVGVEGACCKRFSSLRDTLIVKDMNAQRNPPEPYPECMIFPSKQQAATK